MTRSSPALPHHCPMNIKMTRDQLDVVLNALEADLSSGTSREKQRRPFSEVVAEISEAAKPEDLEHVLARLQTIGHRMGEGLRYKGPLTW